MYNPVITSFRWTRIPIESFDSLDNEAAFKPQIEEVRNQAWLDLVKAIHAQKLTPADIQHVTDSHSLIPRLPTLGEACLYVSWSFTAIIRRPAPGVI